MAYHETDQTMAEDLLDLIEMADDERVDENEREFRRRLVRLLAKMVGEHSCQQLDRSFVQHNERKTWDLYPRRATLVVKND